MRDDFPDTEPQQFKQDKTPKGRPHNMSEPNSSKKVSAPETRTIVLAKVEMTGLRETGDFERFDGVNWRPKTELAPEAKALVWLNEGSKSDVVKAKEFARNEGYSVLTFPTSDANPLSAARTQILAQFNGKEVA